MQKGETYYGRDPLGRRSFLQARQRDGTESLLLASVASRGCLEAGVTFEEVDSGSMWLYDGSTSRRIINRNQDRILLRELRNDIASDSNFAPPSQDEREQALDLVQEALQRSTSDRVNLIQGETARENSSLDTTTVAILFSGGLDSTLLAQLAHLSLPESRTIELINVAFENPRVLAAKKSAESTSQSAAHFDTPDRILCRQSLQRLQQLGPNRNWKLIEINVSYAEYSAAKSDILATMHPCDSVMDLSLASVLFFASQGSGDIESVTSRVYLSGLGADELFGGYSRHLKAFSMGGGAEGQGWNKAAEELQLDLDRLPTRNLGRDDRILSSHGREARYPFLSLPFIRLVASLPLRVKVDWTLGEEGGKGDKVLLRQLARRLGLTEVSGEKKRAMQFGARSAKMEVGDGRIKGHESLSANGPRSAQASNGTAVSHAVEQPNEIFTTMCFSLHPLETAAGYLPKSLLPSDLWQRWFESGPVTPPPLVDTLSIGSHPLWHHIPLLSAHVERLRSSSQAMSKVFPRTWGAKRQRKQREEVLRSPHSMLDALQAQLSENATLAAAPRRRVRWALTVDGQWIVTQAAMDPSPATLPLVRLDSQRTELDQKDREAVAALYLNKTSSRDHYDEARTRVNATLAPPKSDTAGEGDTVFDVLLWRQGASASERPLLTESSIANVLIERSDGSIVTPRLCKTLSDGPNQRPVFLPGIMRQALLAIGCIQEEDVIVEGGAVVDARRIWLCNALRGVFEVKVIN